MRSKLIGTGSLLVAMTAWGALLAACGRPEAAPPPQDVAAPVAAAHAPGLPAEPAPDMAVAPAAAAAKPIGEPELSTMRVAQAEGKVTIPVELRYQFDGDAQSGQPVTLHLAAVSRTAGSNLSMSIKQEPGLQLPDDKLNQPKVVAATAYRRQMSVTRLAGGPQQLRVLVTMDLPVGTGFAWFSVPFGGTPALRK